MLIYDRYLSVREWNPNFCPLQDSIEKITIWVRLYGFPIEYYDHQALIFIGYRIYKTMKVDKTILSREIGKYVRL